MELSRVRPLFPVAAAEVEVTTGAAAAIMEVEASPARGRPLSTPPRGSQTTVRSGQTTTGVSV